MLNCPQLLKLNLGTIYEYLEKNKISETGLIHLSKMDKHKLSHLNLCNTLIVQNITIFLIMIYRSLVKVIGLL